MKVKSNLNEKEGEKMNNNKILGIFSLAIFIIGWILYVKVGIIISLILEVIALVISFISDKKEKNICAKIAFFGSLILITMMIFVIIGRSIFANGIKQIHNR